MKKDTENPSIINTVEYPRLPFIHATVIVPETVASYAGIKQQLATCARQGKSAPELFEGVP